MGIINAIAVIGPKPGSIPIIVPKKQPTITINIFRISFRGNYKNIIEDDLFKKLSSASDINLNILQSELSEDAFNPIKKLFSSKYSVNLDIEYRKLDDSDLSILNPYLNEFASDFKISNKIMNKVINSDYTIIKSIDKSKDSNVPKVTVVEE